jgi:hypothetical protein
VWNILGSDSVYEDNNLLDRKLRIENCSVWAETSAGSGITRVSTNAKVTGRVQERVPLKTKFHELIALPFLIVFWKINLGFSLRHRDHMCWCVGSAHQFPLVSPGMRIRVSWI